MRSRRKKAGIGGFGGSLRGPGGPGGAMRRLLHHPLRPGGLGRRVTSAGEKAGAPGSTAGIESVPGLTVAPPETDVRITCIDYSPARIESREIALTDLDRFLESPRPDWAAVRWIDVDGLSANIVDRFRRGLGMHTLAAEDVLHTPQRPKAEVYDDHLYLVLRMLTLRDERLDAEQISCFLFRGLVVTFQEDPGDVWDPLRQRLADAASRVRHADASFLLYALIDAVVDHCFPILEHFGDQLEDLEARTLEHPSPHTLREVHSLKRELLLLRRAIWPMREAVGQLHRDENPLIAAGTRTYLRDVHDHAVQVIEIIESYREMAGGLAELFMLAMSNRMSQIMKVLTVIATIFIPITFLAGVYGMNMYIPEAEWGGMYGVFWAVCIGAAGGLLWYFRRRGWV